MHKLNSMVEFCRVWTQNGKHRPLKMPGCKGHSGVMEVAYHSVDKSFPQAEKLKKFKNVQMSCVSINLANV